MNSLKAEIRKYAVSIGATLVGFSPTVRLKKAPKSHRPEDILPDAMTVIVFAIPITKGVLLYGPPTQYDNEMEILRYKLDFIMQETARFIEKYGWMAIPVTSDGPYFDWEPERKHGRGDISHKHAAEAAGLGIIGKNSLLINPEYGNRLQLGSIITNVQLEPDPLLDESKKNTLCPANCNICIDSCPVGAIGSNKSINQKLCRSYMYKDVGKESNIVVCNICRKVCPIGINNL